jgi:hypothetical protein
MANLIIKPSTGGDLVIKGSDNSSAITVGTTGTTTFAENATMSGTGNVYGDGTFPAGHALKNTHYAPVVASSAYTSGTVVVLTYNFTPKSTLTNYLLIDIHYPFQFYGNASTVNGQINYRMTHNGVTMFTEADGVCDRHDNNNGSNTFHRLHQETVRFYISETHGSTTTGVARIIKAEVDPTTGRFEVGDNYGNSYINIMEFA